MVMDLEGREYYLHFAPNQPMKCDGLIENMNEESLGVSSYFQQLAKDASKIVTLSSAFPEPNLLEDVLKEYSELFSGQLGTVKGAECEIGLVDQVLVQSPLTTVPHQSSNY
jgi:ribosomal protein L30E